MNKLIVLVFCIKVQRWCCHYVCWNNGQHLLNINKFFICLKLFLCEIDFNFKSCFKLSSLAFMISGFQLHQDWDIRQHFVNSMRSNISFDLLPKLTSNCFFFPINCIWKTKMLFWWNCNTYNYCCPVPSLLGKGCLIRKTFLTRSVPLQK